MSTPIYYDGYVGIGTHNPMEALEVNGPVKVTGVSTTNAPSVTLSYDNTTGTSYITSRGMSADTVGAIELHSSASDGSNTSAKMIIDPNGNVGIGGPPVNGYLEITTNPTGMDPRPHISLTATATSWSLGYVPGSDAPGSTANSNHFGIKCWGMNNITRSGVGGGVQMAPGDASWSQMSDERLKDIKSEIVDVLDKVDNIKCVNYKFKDDPEEYKERVGFLAQNIKELFPMLVADSTEAYSYLSMSYTDMVPIAITAIKELRQELKATQSALEITMQEVQEIKNKLTK